MYMAATKFAACALYPPMLPAMAEPTKFLLMFTSTNASVVVFKICTNSRGHDFLYSLKLSCGKTRHLHQQRQRRGSDTQFKTLPTSRTTFAGMVASHTADLPRPSIQLMAAGFLSVQ